MSVALDFNRSNLSDRPFNTLINQLIEQAEPPSENYRQYLRRYGRAHAVL
jgi:hypothetical protein